MYSITTRDVIIFSQIFLLMWCKITGSIIMLSGNNKVLMTKVPVNLQIQLYEWHHYTMLSVVVDCLTSKFLRLSGSVTIIIPLLVGINPAITPLCAFADHDPSDSRAAPGNLRRVASIHVHHTTYNKWAPVISPIRLRQMGSQCEVRLEAKPEEFRPKLRKVGDLRLRAHSYLSKLSKIKCVYEISREFPEDIYVFGIG